MAHYYLYEQFHGKHQGHYWIKKGSFANLPALEKALIFYQKDKAEREGNCPIYVAIATLFDLPMPVKIGSKANLYGYNFQSYGRSFYLERGNFPYCQEVIN